MTRLSRFPQEHNGVYEAGSGVVARLGHFRVERSRDLRRQGDKKRSAMINA